MDPSVKNVGPGIYLAPSFLSAELCTSVALHCDSNLEWKQAPLGYYKDDRLVASRVDLALRDVEVSTLPNSFDSFCAGYSARVSELLGRVYGIPDLLVDRFVMSRYVRGSHIKPHSDTAMNSTSRIITCVQYFNAGFTGGEIFFPKLRVSISPTTGDLIMFWSEYEHGVTPITSGTRLCMITFGKTHSLLARAFGEVQVEAQQHGRADLLQRASLASADGSP